MLLTHAPLATNWQEMSDQATVIGVIVALLVGIATTVVMIRQEKVTRDGQRLQLEQAKAAADRSESAARLTEEYTRRVVDALETMASRAGSPLAPPPAAPRVQWSLVHHQGDAYRLTNIGDAVAKNVRLTAHESMFLRPPAPGTLNPGEAVTFIAARSMATSDSTITVLWGGLDGEEEHTWRYPLPPRPPRR